VEALTKTDPYYENNQNYAHIDPLWLANLVDTINEALTQIQKSMSSVEDRLTAGGL